MTKSRFHAGVRTIGSASACLLVLILLVSVSIAQQLTGTLTGTVADSAGAVVPNAKITMKNAASGDIRTTVSNGSGYFTVTAVQPGTYSVAIEAPGFKTWERSGITFSQGDNHTLSNVKLEVGNVSETVEIKAGADAVIPDNAEVSTTLNTELVQDTPIVGRDAGELLKVMPGMALTNGLSQGSAFNDKVVGTNNGPVGAYSANGTQPNGAMAFMLDGANLVDPGNAGTQIANINQDMVSEVKVLMSSYSAEYAKGPVIFQAFSKSGGNQFHGEGYLYARNSALNSDDAYAHSQGIPNSNEHYYYIGGNVGGPIPFLNRGKQKVFFWGGYEYMDQHPAASPINYNVPTAEQLSGDFSENTINGLPGTTPVSGCGSNTTLFSCLSSSSVWQYAYSKPYGLPSNAVNNVMPTSDYDTNIVGIAALMPKSNITPSSSNGWNNYQYISTVPQNRWEATGKVDYAISDNSKLSVSYTRQIENDQHPVGVWWTPPWTLPYPSNVVAATTSQEVMANFTHVFSPTTTNELVFTLARYINPSTLSNPKAVSRSALGFNVKGLFGHTADQIPNFEGPWGGAFPNIEEFSFDGSFQSGAFGATKKDPALYDNFTKVIGSHTLKAGFYWDTSENIQSAGGLGPGDNGTYNLGWGPNSSGNVVADFLLGRTGNYQQVSSFPTNDLKFHQWSLYAQDSFKANRQLTLNYGLRFDHVGQWYGTPQGFQVWNPAVYSQNVYGPTGLVAAAPNNTGLQWHQNTSNVPLSGMVSPLFYYEPRVGLAYDIFGTGKTVLRAGFAVFHYQVSTQVSDAATGPQGAFTFQSAGTQTGYNQIDSGAAGFIPPSAVAQNGATVYGLLPGDNKTPLTTDWNVTISQALPWRSVFEVSYVGNKSQNEWIDGGNGKVGDQNNVLPGGFFLPDPTGANSGGANFGKLMSPNAPACTSSTPFNNQPLACAGPFGPNYALTFNANDWRPLNVYQDVYLLYHGSYANYNSLQVSWQKQSGPVVFLTNYTFGKVLGIRDGQTDNGAGNGTVTDPFNIRNNYGPLAYDHTHIFNLSASWNLPKFIHGHRALEGAINGWQLSTYTTYQSGAALQPGLNGNGNAAYAGGLTMPTNALPDLQDRAIRLPNGLEATNVSPQTWFGVSPDNSGFLLMPLLLCDPSKNLKSGQRFNPGCFGMPAYGQQGPLEWPYMRGPAYFDSDLALYKNFQITERQKIQFRMSATNWLNHPLAQFGLAGTTDETLSFTNTGNQFISSAGTGSAGNECAYALANNPGTTSVAGGCMVPYVALPAPGSPSNSATTTGIPKFKTGNRNLLFSVKYFF
jgi:Carboxypeptidase regulatory-like domain/TonB-dependent Receptor Plug Domain